MQQFIDHETMIMGGLVPEPGVDNHAAYVENLQFLNDQINVEYLKPENKILLACLTAFAEATDSKGALTEPALLDYLQADQASPDIVIKFQVLYHQYAAEHVTQAMFRFSLRRFISLKQEARFAEAAELANTIRLTGAIVNKEPLKGFDHAKKYLQDKLTELEQETAVNVMPGGNVHEEAHTISSEYYERKKNPEKFVGLKCGIAHIDDVTNGIQTGELGFIGGGAESGKSFLTIKWAHHSAIYQGKNVLILTKEVPYRQYLRRFVLLHVRNKLFGTPTGIDARQWKRGLLPETDEHAMEKAMFDLTENDTYGRIHIEQISSVTLDWVANKCAYYHNLWRDRGGLHGLFLDSLNIIDNGQQKGESSSAANTKLIRNAKNLALTFDGGRGLPIVTPWHANRESENEAIEKGYFDKNSWHDASEVEKSADILLWLLRIPGTEDTHEILAGLEKYRDGEGHLRFTLYEDFASSYLGTSRDFLDKFAKPIWPDGDAPLF